MVNYISLKSIITCEDVGTGNTRAPSLNVVSLQIFFPTSRELAKIDCLPCRGKRQYRHKSDWETNFTNRTLWLINVYSLKDNALPEPEPTIVSKIEANITYLHQIMPPDFQVICNFTSVFYTHKTYIQCPHNFQIRLTEIAARGYWKKREGVGCHCWLLYDSYLVNVSYLCNHRRVVPLLFMLCTRLIYITHIYSGVIISAEHL